MNGYTPSGLPPPVRWPVYRMPNVASFETPTRTDTPGLPCRSRSPPAFLPDPERNPGGLRPILLNEPPHFHAVLRRPQKSPPTPDPIDEIARPALCKLTATPRSPAPRNPEIRTLTEFGRFRGCRRLRSGEGVRDPWPGGTPTFGERGGKRAKSQYPSIFVFCRSQVTKGCVGANAQL